MVRRAYPSHILYRSEYISTTTSQGQLNGLIRALRDHRTIACFPTVPYAWIPVWNLKFAPPKPLKNWTDDDMLMRVRYKRCHRISLENVLFMDIYTPQVEFENKEDIDTTRPVIVFIPGDVHRGRHRLEGIYGPQYLIRENVVLVIVSYRCGIMGFLKAQDPAAGAPGNVGLMDIEMAFTWVKSEISNFGGDPGNITAYGQGLGACHLYKILSSPDFDEKDLFHKAILSSCFEHKIDGNVSLYENGNFNAISLAQSLFEAQRDCIGKEYSKGELENEVNCVDYLRHLPEYLLQGINATLTTDLTREGILDVEIYRLCIQSYKKQMPIIIGYNSREFNVPKREGSILHYSKFLLKHGAVDLNYEGIPEELLANIRHKQPKRLNEDKILDNLHKFSPNKQIEIFSEFSVICGVLARAGNLAREMTPRSVFLYCFDIVEDPQIEPESNNGKELQYLFGSISSLYYYSPFLRENANLELINLMTMLWAQFARTGDPNPIERPSLMHNSWPRIGAQLTHCLTFTKDGADYMPIRNRENFLTWEDYFRNKFFSAPTTK